MKPLHKLSKGSVGQVVRLDTQKEMRRRLQDMGLIEGTLVQNLHTSPLGDPTAYQIRGAVVALRAKDAETIYIKEK